MLERCVKGGGRKRKLQIGRIKIRRRKTDGHKGFEQQETTIIYPIEPRNIIRTYDCLVR